MNYINIICQTCKNEKLVIRTEEIPEAVTQLFSNWCSKCEHKANDYYYEKYDYTPIPEVLNPNQLAIKFD